MQESGHGAVAECLKYSRLCCNTLGCQLPYLKFANLLIQTHIDSSVTSCYLEHINFDRTVPLRIDGRGGTGPTLPISANYDSCKSFRIPTPMVGDATHASDSRISNDTLAFVEIEHQTSFSLPEYSGQEEALECMLLSHGGKATKEIRSSWPFPAFFRCSKVERNRVRR